MNTNLETIRHFWSMRNTNRMARETVWFAIWQERKRRTRYKGLSRPGLRNYL